MVAELMAAKRNENTLDGRKEMGVFALTKLDVEK